MLSDKVNICEEKKNNINLIDSSFYMISNTENGGITPQFFSNGQSDFTHHVSLLLNVFGDIE